jgi:CheY-like chemotaxis protein
VISLNQLIRENVDILRRLLTPDRTLQLALDDRVPNVRVDPGQLQQVLLNLTINARDAVPAGGKVTLGTSSREILARRRRRVPNVPPGRYVVLTVSDNGAGMDPTIRAHLFEPFFTTKGEGRGTGLGLALVYGVVEQSGGHIVVHTAPKMGSTFEILLPEVHETAVVVDGSVPPLPVTRGRESVLLVEEDEVVRKMVAGILTADGYRVIAAASASAAQRQLRQQREPIHLVIVDCSDRRSKGHRLVRRLRSQYQSLRVLCTSGHETEVLRDVELHLQAVVAKPFALSTVLRVVRRLLDTPDPAGTAPGARG